jgi:hypothetical protein
MTLDTVRDQKKLRDVYQTNDVAPLVFKHLAKKVRDVPRTDLRRLRHAIMHEEGRIVASSDVVEVFAKLQQAGLGKLVKAKKPTDPDRFLWGEGVLSAVHTVLQAVRPAPPMEQHATLAGAEPSNFSSAPQHGSVAMFRLRPSFWAKLPADLSRSEAEALVEWIRALCT